MLAEYQNGAAPSAPTREYIYSGGSLLAKIESGAVQYYHPDQLSVRLMTHSTRPPRWTRSGQADSNGNVIGQHGHYPFGESWYQTNTTTKWFFTSYERDPESGNGYATFRYNLNRLGRFASPDLLGGSIAHPQSLNRYPYVRDDPVNGVDPLGLDTNWLCYFGIDNCPPASGDAGPWDSFDWWNLSGGWDSGSTSHLEECNAANSEDGLTDCEPVSTPSQAWPGDPGHGGGGGGAIAKALKKLQSLLKLDKKCADFLNSKKGDVLGDIGTLLEFGAFGATAIPPSQNPDGSTTVVNAASGGYIQGQAITVNTNGAFFNSTFNGAPLSEDRGKSEVALTQPRDSSFCTSWGTSRMPSCPMRGTRGLLTRTTRVLRRTARKLSTR